MIISPTWKSWTANIVKNKQGNVVDISTVNPRIIKENVGHDKVATYIPISTIFPTAIPKVSTASIMKVMPGHLTTENNLYKTYAQPPQQQNNKGFSKTTLLIIVALISILTLYFIMK